MNKKRVLFIVVISLVVVLLAAIVYVLVTTLNKGEEESTADERDYTSLTNKVKDEKIENNADFSGIIARYSEDHQRIYNEVRISDPTKWDRTMVEKAYFVIEVSRKVSEYPIVDMTLQQLSTAKDAGVNVDIESIGANQAYRDTLRAETDDALSNPDYLPTNTKREL